MSESESLVERVARALDPLAWAALGLADTEKLAFRRKRSMEQAVVAIQAMREPTEAMLNASIEALPAWREGLDPDEKLLRHVIKDGRGYTEATVPEKHAIRFRAAIDAALA